MFDSLPSGFMYDLFRSAFEGVSIEKILSEVEKFELVSDWINYGISKINEVCRADGIEEFHPCLKPATGANFQTL
jgi:hypothetical protein